MKAICDSPDGTFDSGSDSPTSQEAAATRGPQRVVAIRLHFATPSCEERAESDMTSEMSTRVVLRDTSTSFA